MNGVNVIGNLASDVELRDLPSGDKQVATFYFAGGRSRSKDEAKKGKAEVFINVECWNGLANLANTYLSKGAQVGVVGRLVSERYEKDGEKKTAFKIVADDLTFIGGRPDGGTSTDAQPSGAADDDIPF